MKKHAAAEKRGETYRSGIGASMLIDEANAKNKENNAVVCKWPGCGGNHKDACSKQCKYNGKGKVAGS